MAVAILAITAALAPAMTPSAYPTMVRRKWIKIRLLKGFSSAKVIL